MTLDATGTGAAGAATGTEAGQSSSGTPAGAGAPAAGAAAPQTATGQPPEGTLSPEDAAKLRNENAAQRRRLEALEKAERERQQAAMTEAEKLAAEKLRIEEEKATLAKERQAFALRQVTLVAAGRAGAIYPDVIDSMILSRVDEVTFNEAGQPTNIDALLGAIRKSHPHLFRAPAGTADGGAGGQAGRPATGGMNDAIRRAAGRA